jgi:hypothetical protein
MPSSRRLPEAAVRLGCVAVTILLAPIACAHGERSGSVPSSTFGALAANEAPASRDALFGDESSDKKESRDALVGDDTKNQKGSRDSLFGDAAEEATAAPAWHGFVRGELAYTYAEPAHWSKMLVRSQLEGHGAFAENVKYKIGARLDYDFVYDAIDFYPPDVRRDQRVNFLLRENYLDFGAGDWDFRIGKQQVVWGEVVALFVADVVSAKDLREFILPDFDVMRIPQWTARAEYSRNDFHAEAIWIPAASYDNIGKPGAEFFPAVLPPPAGFATLFDNEQFPERRISNSNFGARLSWLTNGWDLSGFYYRSMDTSATFYRQIHLQPEPAFVYQARHDRIDQVGATLAKDLGSVVLKAESVYTHGRSFSVVRIDDDDGVVPQNTLDWILSADFTLPADTRFNAQLFGRTFFDHDPDIAFKRNEPGFSVLLNRKFSDGVEAEFLFIGSLNRSDWMLRPKLVWNFRTNWRLIAGVDLFNGPPLGLFGQYANRDRVYAEVRYSF